MSNNVKVEFPVCDWIDSYLRDNYDIEIEWDSEFLASHRDYSNLGISFSLDDIRGNALGIKEFMEDYDLHE